MSTFSFLRNRSKFSQESKPTFPDDQLGFFPGGRSFLFLKELFSCFRENSGISRVSTPFFYERRLPFICSILSLWEEFFSASFRYLRSRGWGVAVIFSLPALHTQRLTSSHPYLRLGCLVCLRQLPVPSLPLVVSLYLFSRWGSSFLCRFLHIIDAPSLSLPCR